MSPTRIKTDICVIGAGSGGLTVAAGAAQLGASTVLIEKDRMGGECLNTGCVPSKALIAAAAAAETVRRAGRFGIRAAAPEIDFAAVNDHVHGVIAAIAPHDSVARFTGLGVKVIAAAARFTGRRIVAAGDHEIEARRFVVATGSGPAIPAIPGLDTVPFLTNETVFGLRAAPEHLIVIGGGPIGAELAQAHRRLGARVTILETFSLLDRNDAELVDVVRNRLAREGVDIREGVGIAAVEAAGGAVRVRLEGGDAIEGSHLLVAAGRRPNVDGLDLEAAGVRHSAQGIEVDRRLRTANRRIFAIGDVVGPHRFTHVAGYHAGIVLRNALFRMPAKVDYRALPRVTYTAPELAQIGMGEAEARDAHGDIRILRFPFADNDRAQAEREPDGLVKAITTKRGTVVGVGMVGAHAGELVQSWILPISRRMNVKHMAGLVLPYPTLGEVNKRAAWSYLAPRLFADRVKRIVRLLARLG